MQIIWHMAVWPYDTIIYYTLLTLSNRGLWHAIWPYDRETVDFPKRGSPTGREEGSCTVYLPDEKIPPPSVANQLGDGRPAGSYFHLERQLRATGNSSSYEPQLKATVKSCSSKLQLRHMSREVKGIRHMATDGLNHVIPRGRAWS